jgi:hypothetical protein
MFVSMQAGTRRPAGRECCHVLAGSPCGNDGGGRQGMCLPLSGGGASGGGPGSRLYRRGGTTRGLGGENRIVLPVRFLGGSRSKEEPCDRGARSREVHFLRGDPRNLYEPHGSPLVASVLVTCTPEAHEPLFSHSGRFQWKKGLRRKTEIPLSIVMVPKAGFEPARVSHLPLKNQ